MMPSMRFTVTFTLKDRAKIPAANSFGMHLGHPIPRNKHLKHKDKTEATEHWTTHTK